MNGVNREILLGFWKLHILHHASTKAVHGQRILTELRRHGHEISSGTLYPLLSRMERLGWLKGKAVPRGGPRARGIIVSRPKGGEVPELLREPIRELYEEVVELSRKGAIL
jgi:PadR family transcriptional regulator PadR